MNAKATHRVIRPIWGGADKIPAGTEVDTTNWKYVDLLVEQGYLVPIEQDKNESESVLPLDSISDKTEKIAA